MLLRLRNWVVVVGLVLVTGGHWAVLQSVAWVGMTIQYSRSENLTAALQKTFDGQHPCKLCKAVKEGREAEQKQPLLKVEVKFDFFLSACRSTIAPPVVLNEYNGYFQKSDGRGDTPPTPPPRFA
jgi:hypothetical protein